MGTSKWSVAKKSKAVQGHFKNVKLLIVPKA